MADTRVKDILRYWFGEPPAADVEKWFGAADEVDEHIRRNFTQDVERAERGELSAWEAAPDSCLALIILLDQFPMNMERDSRRCYERSALAIPIAKRAIEKGFDHQVHPAMKMFFYLPLEHSETLADQERSVALFQKALDDAPPGAKQGAEMGLDYAIQHYDVVKKFGRFPGRNEAFGRKSSPEEQKYLDDGGWF